jgi:hypothetical protein
MIVDWNRMRLLLLIALLTSHSSLAAQVKVGGREVVPEGLIFADADAKSRIVAEGELSDGCGWVLSVETKFAEEREAGDCLLDYRRTTVTLAKKCAAPAQPEVTTSERVTTAPRARCPESSGDVPPLRIDSKTISFGRVPDGQWQAIVEQPDGTRLVLAWNAAAVRLVIRYPDGTSDTVTAAAIVEKKEKPD